MSQLQLKHNALLTAAAAANPPRTVMPDPDVNHGYDPRMPWNAVITFCMAEANSKWWDKEFRTPAVIILSKAGMMAQSLGGDARISRDAQHSRAIDEYAEKNRPLAIEDVKRTKNTERGGDGKLHTHNAKRYELCRGFQRGTCTQTVNGNKCSVSSNHVHQCARCMSTKHGAHHPEACKAPLAKFSAKSSKGTKKKDGDSK